LGTSMTPGHATAPVTVISDVPGSSAVPVLAKSNGPTAASRPSWATVSALARNVGAPPTRLPRARASPVTKRPPPLTTSIPRWSVRAEARSAVAIVNLRSDSSSSAATTTRRAPSAAAVTSAPSRTRCGTCRIKDRSLWLRGSPSLPLTMMTSAPSLGSASSLRATGNAAPPRPRSRTARTSSVSR